ncbi:MAG: thiamine pyrophosphate-dependent enzyme [Methylocystis sp.]|uniref:thiamine pyrophosphate-dependent enzyme n=1 Tax=Methylocystis sp. TaxID=1911079 RepID=UPI003DA5A561
MSAYTVTDLQDFEREVADAFEARRIHAPVHLSDGNEAQLIEIFREIPSTAWVFSNWRSHYHALLHGVPRELVMSEILAGRSMMLHFPEYRFFTSAIVGGILPIACGVAKAGFETFCFVGDMCASIGAFHDAEQYASGHELPLTLVVEDNSLSTNTPTKEVWGRGRKLVTMKYKYRRGKYPHVGSGVFVPF